MKVETKDYNLLNKRCRVYTLSNNYMSVKILSVGATILEINVPDKNGNLENVVLKHNDILIYSSNPFYFGATLGRTAGRIKNGEVYINGRPYVLTRNNAGNTLHGGKRGFSLENFSETRIINNDSFVGVVLTYMSADKEEGYPGNLKLEVWYTLNEQNELKIRYRAISDKDTICNISNHSYFNMNPKKSILDQSIIINSNYYYENQGGLVIGKREKVDNTPFDFRVERTLGYDRSNPLLHVFTNGYDHLFEFNNDNNQVILKDYDSGRMMTLETSYKACHVFNFEFRKRDAFYSGVTFECQKLPYKIDNPENETILRANEDYEEVISYRFETIK